MHNGSIGVFDSGVGGLSIYRHIRKQLPNESLIYFADSGFAPYGDKSSEFVIERTFKIAQYLLNQQCKALVVACNTATAEAIQLLRERYKDLVIIGVEPGLKPALRISQNNTIGVLATARTLASQKFLSLYQKLSTENPHAHFILQSCSGLANAIERYDINDNAVIQLVNHYVTPLLKSNVDTIVLGCTHYPFIAQHIINLAKQFNTSVHLIDTGQAVAKQLVNRLKETHLLTNGMLKNHQFITSGDPQLLQTIMSRLLNEPITIHFSK